MHLPNIVATSSSDRYRVIRWQVTGNPSVTDQPTVETTLADALEQVLMELKKLQDQVQGRVRLQYAVAEKCLYVVAHIADYDEEASDTLYDELSNWEAWMQPLGWEVKLIVVEAGDVFSTYHKLNDI
jgi:hypothetical protein